VTREVTFPIISTYSAIRRPVVLAAHKHN